MKAFKKNLFVSLALVICLCASFLAPCSGLITANAEYADCWYDHEHVEATGYSTGETYYVEKGFGSDVVYEAVKLEDDEIVVDGFKDDAWYDAYEIDTFVITENDNNNRGTQIVASYMWDDENLYVWAEIYDSTYVLSWDNGENWAAWGDYCELYVDTLHNSSLAIDGWTGNDGPDYRGKNSNSGCWPDGSEYEDCCFGQFKISAGFYQTLDPYEKDTKKGRGGAIQWQQWTWLSAACQEDNVSLFTSAFIYEDRDLSEPYERYTTYGGIQNGAELALGRPIGYTFEAKINFKSSEYMPEEGSIIGAGLRIADMTDISWWGDMGGDYCIYAQEKNAGSMWGSPKNLPHLALLPGEGGSSDDVDDTQYTISFEVEGRVVDTFTGPRKTVVEAPKAPVKPGYKFVGWKGFKEGYTIKSDKTFVAEYERVMDALPEWPDEYQDPSYEDLPDGYSVNAYEIEKTTGTIEIDGVMDELYYMEGIAVEVIELVDGETDIEAFAYLLWDDENLYVFVVVYDTYVSTIKDSSNPWLSDSVELVIDTYNRPSGQQQGYGDGYRGKDYVGEGQFRLNAGENVLSGMHWMFDNSEIKKSGASRIIEGEGYTAEFKIGLGSFKDKADIDEQIAFAIVINDGEGSERNGIIATEPEQNHAHEWAGVLSKLYLSDYNDTPVIEHPIIFDEPTVDDNSSEPGLSGGAIAGIAVGSTAVAGVGAFSIVWFAVKKKSFADLIAAIKGIFVK